MQPDDTSRLEAQNMSHQNQDIQELKTIQDDIYNELMNSNLVIETLLFGIFFVLLVTIPIQIFSVSLIENQQPLQLAQILIPFEVIYFAVPLLSTIAIGYFNIKFVATFNDRIQLFEEIDSQLLAAGTQTTQKISLTETQHYKLVIRIETAFVVGTFFAACLWFLLPSYSRLEPLTIVYGFGTAIFEYFRTKLKIPNPLDRFVAIKATESQDLPTNGDNQ